MIKLKDMILKEGKSWEDPKPENIADEFIYEFGSPRNWKDDGGNLKDWMLNDWGPNTNIHTRKGFDDCYEEVEDILKRKGYKNLDEQYNKQGNGQCNCGPTSEGECDCDKGDEDKDVNIYEGPLVHEGAVSRDVHRAVNKFIKKMADDNDYPLQHAVNAIMAVLKSQNYNLKG